MFQVTKTFGHDLGISVAFRQWRADSHCKYVHGYAMSFSITFEANELDERGWVIDFGCLKPLKDKIQDEFDHKLLVANDDPDIETFRKLNEMGIANVKFWHGGVGCEKFAFFVYCLTSAFLKQKKLSRDVRVVSVTASEHGANSATFYNGDKE